MAFLLLRVNLINLEFDLELQNYELTNIEKQTQLFSYCAGKSPISLYKYTWAMSWQNLISPYANNKGTDQPAHPLR